MHAGNIKIICIYFAALTASYFKVGSEMYFQTRAANLICICSARWVKQVEKNWGCTILKKTFISLNL